MRAETDHSVGRLGLALIAVCMLAACDPLADPNAMADPDLNAPPEESGITISGYVIIGVVREWEGR